MANSQTSHSKCEPATEAPLGAKNENMTQNILMRSSNNSPDIERPIAYEIESIICAHQQFGGRRVVDVSQIIRFISYPDPRLNRLTMGVAVQLKIVTAKAVNPMFTTAYVVKVRLKGLFDQLFNSISCFFVLTGGLIGMSLPHNA